MISEQTKEYFELGKRNDVREHAKRLRRQFLRYKDAEIVYSIHHKKLLEMANVYAIPANYTDSGKLLGGMVEPRNAVEAVALVIMVGYPEVKWIPMPTTIRIVIMTVTLIPLAVVAFMGIGGDSLLQYLGHILSFWENRRILHFRRIGYKYDPKQLKKPGRKGKKKEAGKA